MTEVLCRSLEPGGATSPGERTDPQDCQGSGCPCGIQAVLPSKRPVRVGLPLAPVTPIPAFSPGRGKGNMGSITEVNRC